MSKARSSLASVIPAWALGVALAASSPVLADGLSVGEAHGTADCGGDAYSSAQIVEGRRDRRGPIEVVPRTLCADLAPQRPVEWGIEAYPLVAPSIGGGRHSAPYERRQR